MHPSIIQGWHVPKEEYLHAYTNNGLVKLLIELSNTCNLSCPGCFTKRAEGSWNGNTKKRLPNEMDYSLQLQLLEEAVRLGVQTVDIVGAGEPTLDPHFYDIVNRINDLGMHVVVFTHGVSKVFEDMGQWKNRNVSFFLKLWSRDPALQNGYVDGKVSDYSRRRDLTLERMITAGLNVGGDVVVDNTRYTTTRIGADVLVMNSNYSEIPDLLRFCRERNIMPIIKTYIPEGPTRFTQTENLKIYQKEHLAKLKQDEVSPEAFATLRRQLVAVDRETFGIPDLQTFYPQAVKCTQSMASLYVTITGDIRSCVGTHISYGKYEPGKNMLSNAIRQRVEKVGFGCVPRLEEIKERKLLMDQHLQKIYSDGML